MAKDFKLTVLSPEKKLYEGEVISLVVPAALGYLGVLADHAPLVASLSRGKIMIKDTRGESVIFPVQTKGFLEVKNNNVTIILDRLSIC